MPEIIDDLKYNGLMILRDPAAFSYNQDSVLLANAVKAAPNERVLDMCAGGCIVSILAAAKTGAHFTAAELQPALCDMARRSVELNSQQEQIDIVNADIRSLHETLGHGKFDAAACNPPYFQGGTKSVDSARRLSTHQEECTVMDVAACARRMLKNGGRFYMVYPAARLAEAICALSGAGVEVKRLTPVCSKRGRPPYLFLYECKKGARVGLTIQTPVILEESE